MFYVTISKMLLRKAYNISAIKSQKYPVDYEKKNIVEIWKET